MELQADAKLTKRENQIAGLAFCGKAKKEIAALNIDFQQLQKTIVALSFLGIIAFQIAFDCNNDLNRSRRARIRRNKIEEVYEL